MGHAVGQAESGYAYNYKVEELVEAKQHLTLSRPQLSSSILILML